MKVVKLLENMLKESNKESVSERLTFAKFKCYCDDNEREKKDSIEDLTKKIGFLEAKIEELKGAGGKLTQEILKLNTDMNQNEATRKSAEALRTQAHENFLSEESDMENGIGGFGDAIKVLAELGGDSFVDTTPDRKKIHEWTFPSVGCKIKFREPFESKRDSPRCNCSCLVNAHA